MNTVLVALIGVASLAALIGFTIAALRGGKAPGEKSGRTLKSLFVDMGLQEWTHREVVKFLTGKTKIAPTPDQNAIETEIAEHCGADLGQRDRKLREEVEAPLGYIRAATMDVHAPVAHLVAAQADLEQSVNNNIRNYQQAVEEQHTVEAKIHTHEVLNDVDASDVEAWNTKVRKSLLLAGGETLFNAVTFASSGQLAAGFLGGASAAALLSVVNVGGGAFTGIATRDIAKPYKPLLVGAIFVVDVALNSAAAVFRTGGSLQLDFPNIAMVVCGVLFFGFSFMSWKSLPPTSHRLAWLYRQKEPAQRKCEWVYQTSLQDIHSVRDAAVEALEEGAEGTGLTIVTSQTIEDLKSAAAFVEDAEKRYREDRMRILDTYNGLVTEHRDQVRAAVGQVRPLPAYFYEKPDLSTKFSAVDVDVPGLKTLVETLVQDGEGILNAIPNVIVELDKALEATAEEFRREAKAIASTPQYTISNNLVPA